MTVENKSNDDDSQSESNDVNSRALKYNPTKQRTDIIRKYLEGKSSELEAYSTKLHSNYKEQIKELADSAGTSQRQVIEDAIDMLVHYLEKIKKEQS